MDIVSTFTAEAGHETAWPGSTTAFIYGLFRNPLSCCECSALCQVSFGPAQRPQTLNDETGLTEPSSSVHMKTMRDTRMTCVGGAKCVTNGWRDKMMWTCVSAGHVTWAAY